MSYESYMISDFRTSIAKEKQPWLIPDDAQESLINGYIQHGIINKRDGYNFYANGLRANEPYCESRIVSRVKLEAFSVGDGTVGPYNHTEASLPVRRGTCTITAGAQTATDDGVGGFITNPVGGSGSIDYNTGITSITFQNVVPGATAITATYDYHPGTPVMMIANFITANDTVELLVADTQNLNRYNSLTNRFDDITPTSQFTGSSHDFFTWVQYPTILDKPRLLFTNNVDQIKSYDGTNVVDWYPVIESIAVAGEAFGTGTGIAGPYTHTAANLIVMPTSVVITADPGGSQQVVKDDGAGNLTGNGTGTVNYTTGAMSVTFTNVVPNGKSITLNYSHSSKYITTCQTMLGFKDRILLFRTTEEGGVVHPQRIRISGLGQSGDDFRTSASGAGAIDVPTHQWLQGAVFNRDDVMFFNKTETWMLKYSGNDIVPFVPGKIDGTMGNFAPFAPISYLNMTKAYSPYGFTISDGYQVNRYDDRIPDFSFDDIDQDNFDLCFSGTVEDDKNHYLIYPTQGESASNRILVNSYEENGFSIFRIPLSCMGTYFESFDIDWDFLSAANGFPSWEVFAQKYATWNDISYSKGQPISLGGGQKGEIWRLNGDESEDNPLLIWGITDNSTSPASINVETDWHNYDVGDHVFFAGVGGAIEINNKEAIITAVGSNTTITAQFEAGNPQTISAFTSGGTVSKTIPFEFTTKNFNPYIQANEKVRCGWMNIYVDASRTIAMDVEGNVVPTKIKLEIFSNDSTVPSQKTSIDIPIEGNLTNFDNRRSLKVWRKIYINQNSRFLQFKLSNYQPGTRIRIHALEPGFMPGGRLI